MCGYLAVFRNRQTKGFCEGSRGEFGLWKKVVFERQILGIKENGIKEEYQLADEGVIQAQLAGELFLKELKESSIPL
ncbi:uncharacterized protein LOC133699747 isoform X2 [Populus nigra]|uniref:uncharacterized protein LOC133699747 isoform X2 n=1 Tax=Populus nigra TaxID=3691 RepID=UPI002B279220|nr:uncharacterized protein LOC133699747 isoform X2 [Populus nigra]